MSTRFFALRVVRGSARRLSKHSRAFDEYLGILKSPLKDRDGPDPRGGHIPHRDRPPGRGGRRKRPAG